ncbi:39S ribosomal protein L35, mitochondrial [Daktulosphaira vitifoliae]|uniref:39S ribosomal protein L35, mitochondrial n=1 Tax=Daktulosphaira vitifoliae TaxID=58002 RepID=UPI0021AA7D4B|nr:39S ribosomal protein L35, mitochondrial [Daktulosphaira vitifoliae]
MMYLIVLHQKKKLKDQNVLIVIGLIALNLRDGWNVFVKIFSKLVVLLARNILKIETMLKQVYGSLFSVSSRLLRRNTESLLPKQPLTNLVINKSLPQSLERCRFYSMLSRINMSDTSLNQNKFILPVNILSNFNIQQNRNLTKFSLGKGKRKSVKAVVDRFYRLAWGIWIRTKCGRNKKMWKKPASRKRRLRQHVFCNAKQSTLLDKMTTKYWKKRRFYPDDPYEPYHSREEFPFTRKKPLLE